MSLSILQDQQVLLILCQPNPITISKILELGTVAHTYHLGRYHQNFKIGYCSSKIQEASVERGWRDKSAGGWEERNETLSSGCDMAVAS